MKGLAAHTRCARLERVSEDLAGLLRQAATTTPDRVALVDGAGRRLTWSELDAEVDRVAHGYEGLGLVPGYRVMLALGNRVEFVTSYLAALRARLVAVPVNPRSATGETVRMLVDCGARVVLTDTASVTTVRQAVAGLEDALIGAEDELRRRTTVPRTVLVDGLALPGELRYEDLAASSRPTSAAAPAPSSVPDPESLAVLLYTSGTSGRPRAAMLSHRALAGNVAQVARAEPPMVRPDDVVLGVVPLFHVYGLNAVLGQVLRQASTLVLCDGFDPDATLALIAEESVTVLPVAPVVFARWAAVPDLRERLAGVRVVLSGSAPVTPEVVQDFVDRSGVAVHQGYGLTEAAPVVTSTLVSPRVVPGSVGAALPGVEIRLVDETGAVVAPEDAGEISIRGANLFDGYWPEGADGPDAQGWFATGDIGYLDATGDLFLVDRVKELVIVSGFNVYPVEVEEVLVETAGVSEAAVIGRPDPRTGEAVVAYVTRADDSVLSPEDLVDAVRAHCAARLARFKQPTEVRVVAELPHTVTGKVAKGRLRAAQRRQHAGLLQ